MPVRADGGDAEGKGAARAGGMAALRARLAAEAAAGGGGASPRSRAPLTGGAQ
jgi:hypothetical protein